MGALGLETWRGLRNGGDGDDSSLLRKEGERNRTFYFRPYCSFRLSFCCYSFVSLIFAFWLLLAFWHFAVHAFIPSVLFSVKQHLGLHSFSQYSNSIIL